MKKIALMAAALFALAAVVFAKPAKVKGWKDVAKIANKNDLEVVSDYTDWYVAKGNGGKDFAIYAVKDYADLKVTLEMSCIDGEVYSRIVCVDKEANAPLPIFALSEGADKCVVVNADSLSVYYKDEGIAIWTEECKNQRAKLLGEIAKEYGIAVPKN